MVFVILALIFNPFVSYLSQFITLVLFIGKNIVHEIIVLWCHTAWFGPAHASQVEFIHVRFQIYSVLALLVRVCRYSWGVRTSLILNIFKINRWILSVFINKSLFLFILYSDWTVQVFSCKSLTLLENFTKLVLFIFFFVLSNCYQTTCVLLQLIFVLVQSFLLDVALLSPIEIDSLQLIFLVMNLLLLLFAHLLVFFNIGQDVLPINFCFVGHRRFLALDLRIEHLSQLFLVPFFLLLHFFLLHLMKLVIILSYFIPIIGLPGLHMKNPCAAIVSSGHSFAF